MCPSSTTATSCSRRKRPSSGFHRSKASAKGRSGRTGGFSLGLGASILLLKLACRMAAAEPASLARDVLEVSRGHHLLGQRPTDQTSKALAAAERKLAAKEARRQARIKANRSEAAQKAFEEQGQGQEDQEMEEGNVSLLDAVGDAMTVDPEAVAVAQPEKIKVKTKMGKKKRSNLVPSAQSMSMDMS